MPSGRVPDHVTGAPKEQTLPGNSQAQLPPGEGNSGKQARERLAHGASRVRRGEALRPMTEGEDSSGRGHAVRGAAPRSPRWPVSAFPTTAITTATVDLSAG